MYSARDVCVNVFKQCQSKRSPWRQGPFLNLQTFFSLLPANLTSASRRRRRIPEPINKTSERRRMAACHWPGQAKNKFFAGERAGFSALFFARFGGFFSLQFIIFASSPLPLPLSLSFACQKHLVWLRGGFLIPYPTTRRWLLDQSFI